jgi:hypothetical protein
MHTALSLTAKEQQASLRHDGASTLQLHPHVDSDALGRAHGGFESTRVRATGRDGQCAGHVAEETGAWVMRIAVARVQSTDLIVSGGAGGDEGISFCAFLLATRLTPAQLRSDGHASRVKILEGELKAMKEKLSLLLNKGNDDDALIDALKRELIAVKQQQQQPGISTRVTSAGREKPSAAAGGAAGAASSQLTSALKSDLSKAPFPFTLFDSTPSLMSAGLRLVTLPVVSGCRTRFQSRSAGRASAQDYCRS